MSASPTIPTLRAAIALEIRKALSPGDPSLVASVVHERRRWWNDETKFRSLFTRTDGTFAGKLNGYHVYRSSTREVEAPEWFRFWQLHRFEIEGFLAVEDRGKSGEKLETVIHDQIEQVRENLRLSPSIFITTERAQPVVQVETVERVTVGEASFWRAQLSLEPESIDTRFS